MPLLLLFDIDGTLLQRASVEHAQAIVEAAQELHGIDGLARHRVEAAGRTDLAIARDMLLRAGVEPRVSTGPEPKRWRPSSFSSLPGGSVANVTSTTTAMSGRSE